MSWVCIRLNVGWVRVMVVVFSLLWFSSLLFYDRYRLFVRMVVVVSYCFGLFSYLLVWCRWVIC